jgi:hypothetical protein
MSCEQLKAQFLLEHFQLPADPRLRGVQLLGGGRDVETILVDRDQIAELLKFHAYRI